MTIGTSEKRHRLWKIGIISRFKNHRSIQYWLLTLHQKTCRTRQHTQQPLEKTEVVR